MSLADELAMRVAVEIVSAEHPADINKSIITALREYGEAVRRRDVEVCQNLELTECVRNSDIDDLAEEVIHRRLQDRHRRMCRERNRRERNAQRRYEAWAVYRLV